MNYLSIAKIYANLFDIHGPICKGIDWPNEAEILARYAAMIHWIPNEANILDFGCGYAGLLKYLIENNIPINYIGLDINSNYIEYCKNTYPEINFYCVDIIREKFDCEVDYIVMNGVLTAKYNLCQSEMAFFANDLLRKCFSMCKKGMAINFTSPYCNKHKNKLFCPNLNEVGDMATSLTKKFIIDHKRLPYEQILYLWK